MLTTKEAADFLGVPRPYLTRPLKTGKLPYRKKGNHHLVPVAALETFKSERDRRLHELAALAAAEWTTRRADRHVPATAVTAGAQVVATANTAHFRSRRLDAGQIRVEEPAAFLAAVLEEHPELIAAALEHLAKTAAASALSLTF